MELDDFKAKAREVTAPGGGRAGGEGTDGLLRAIREADRRAAIGARKARPLYAIAAATFLAGAGLSLASVAPAAGARIVHFGAIGGVFLLVALLLHGKARSLTRIDYSKPVKEYLAEAERRYRLVRPVDLVYSIPLLLVLALTGGRLVLEALVPRYVAASHALVVVLAYAVFFLAVCGVGWYFTYENWRKENGTLLAEIRRMRQDMQ